MDLLKETQTTGSGKKKIAKDKIMHHTFVETHEDNSLMDKAVY